MILHIIKEPTQILGCIPARKTACLEDIAIGLVESPCLCLESQPKSIKGLLILREMMHVSIQTALLAEL
jgi:hypothetical protein